MNPRIFGAFLVGAGLIASAYFLAPKNEISTQVLDPATAVVSGVAPNREYITIEDSDNDGIPDWSEQFRQANPVEVTEVEPTEVYTPPDTLTGKLAIELLTDKVQAKKFGPLGPSNEAILKKTSSSVLEAGTDTLYTVGELSVSTNNSREALHTYGNTVAIVLTAETLSEDTRWEVDIVQHAVKTSNETILEELDPIIASYAAMTNLMLGTEVPSSMVQDHLNLLNTLNALKIDTEGMKTAFSDPLYTMVRMQRYYDDATGLNNAIVNLYTALSDAGVEWNEGDAALNLISIE